MPSDAENVDIKDLLLIESEKKERRKKDEETAGTTEDEEQMIDENCKYINDLLDTLKGSNIAKSSQNARQKLFQVRNKFINLNFLGNEISESESIVDVRSKDAKISTSEKGAIPKIRKRIFNEIERKFNRKQQLNTTMKPQLIRL